MTNEILRQKWRKYWTVYFRLRQFTRVHPEMDIPPLTAFSEELRGLCCGARTRAGTPCQRKDLYANGRCKLHGGLSTGPKTKKGKASSRINGQKGGRPKRVI